MKVMLLAAGRGQRMRPLTDHCPKPLLPVAGRPLIEYHLRNLARAGLIEVVINLAYRGRQIREFVGNGSLFGLSVQYSEEGDSALETGGGIRNALSLLSAHSDAPFAVINGDVYTDYPLERLRQNAGELRGTAHLVVVDNPDHHPRGDFSLREGRVKPAVEGETSFTFSGLGVYRPSLLRDAPVEPAAFPLAPVLMRAAARGEVSAELYPGLWSDVGTPHRLDALDRLLERGYPSIAHNR